MARIAFGRVNERMELVGLLSDAQGRDARIAYLRNQMVTAPTEVTNRISSTDRVSLRSPILLWARAKPLPSAPTVAAISRL